MERRPYHAARRGRLAPPLGTKHEAPTGTAAGTAVAQQRDPPAREDAILAAHEDNGRPARKSAADHDEATLVSVEEEVFRGEGGGDEAPGVELAAEPVRAVLLAAKREPVAAVSADRKQAMAYQIDAAASIGN